MRRRRSGRGARRSFWGLSERHHARDAQSSEFEESLYPTSATAVYTTVERRDDESREVLYDLIFNYVARLQEFQGVGDEVPDDDSVYSLMTYRLDAGGSVLLDDADPTQDDDHRPDDGED